MAEYLPGDRVCYRNANLWNVGTVRGRDGLWVLVQWDGHPFTSREAWDNLRTA